MKNFISVLKDTKMFEGIKEEEILGMLSCLGARLCTYQKGEFVLKQGEKLKCIAILVKGKLHIQRDDYWGNRSILGQIEEGDIFGEAYVSPMSGALMNDVVALEDSKVIYFDMKRILTSCSSACVFHTKVIENLFFSISEKNLKLVQKIGYMSKRSTREKLLSYLSEQSRQHKNAKFEIPFNRQQLADYLSVDRSAMSNELCKMRDEGILELKKNHFRLL